LATKPKSGTSRLELKVRVGKALRRRRESLNISQEDFSEKVEMHRTYYSQIERGKKDLRIGTLAKICSALGITITELFNDVEPLNGSGAKRTTTKMKRPRPHQ
jgi:transcriptional regulator with XRE-family HTH domain